MRSELKTLVVVATTCTLFGLIVTYTVGQSNQTRSDSSSEPKWKTKSAAPRVVEEDEAEPAGGEMSPVASAAFWSENMGDSPADLSAAAGEVPPRDPFRRDDAPVNAGGMASVQDSQVATERRVAPELSQQASEFLTTMQSLESRLQKLGATYYRLESSEDGLRFRFHCEMPLAEQPGFHRFFEADGQSPEASMEQVINAVEQWLAARSPS